jgi:hypothetical protein
MINSAFDLVSGMRERRAKDLHDNSAQAAGSQTNAEGQQKAHEGIIDRASGRGRHQGDPLPEGRHEAPEPIGRHGRPGRHAKPGPPNSHLGRHAKPGDPDSHLSPKAATGTGKRAAK